MGATASASPFRKGFASNRFLQNTLAVAVFHKNFKLIASSVFIHYVHLIFSMLPPCFAFAFHSVFHFQVQMLNRKALRQA